jgi:hypothetical protein
MWFRIINLQMRAKITFSRNQKTKPKPKERETGREEVFPYHLASGKWNKSQKEHK